jgi:hypothetical protein
VEHRRDRHAVLVTRETRLHTVEDFDDDFGNSLPADEQ